MLRFIVSKEMSVLMVLDVSQAMIMVGIMKKVSVKMAVVKNVLVLREQIV